MKIFRTYAYNNSGGVIVESALLLPLFIAAGLGTLDASNLMLQNHKLETQLSMASTFLSKSSNPDLHEETAKKLALTGTSDGTGSVKITGWESEDISISYITTTNENGEYRGETSVQTVRVASSLDYKGFGVISSIMPNGIKLRAEVQERLVGGGL